MKNPKISIISVVFNLIKNDRKKTFLQMIESVAKQTYSNIEHIIVDGASNDGTIELIKKVAKKYKKITWISEKDTGIYDAMNKGAKLATGKYISYLNSDDYYHNKTGVEKVVKKLEKEDADFLYSPVLILSETGKKRVWKPQIHRYLTHMPFGHQGLFVKKNIFIKLKLFSKKLKIASDYGFILKLILSNAKGILVNNIFATFREGGASEDKAKDTLEKAIIFEKNYSKYRKYSKKEWIRFVKKRQLPIRLLFAMFLKNVWKKAVLYQIWRTIRKSII